MTDRQLRPGANDVTVIWDKIYNAKIGFQMKRMSLSGSGRLTVFLSKSEVRTKVLADLSKGPMTPTELASIEKKHVSHVSRALAELRAEGLVEPISTSSKERYYRATDRGLMLSLQFLKLK